MKKSVLVAALLFFLLAVGMAFSANHIKNENDDKKVDKEVEELLKENDEVSVIVVLEDDPDVLTEQYSASQLNKMDNSKKEKMMIAEQQEEVLEKLDLNYDFELKNKFSSVNGFSGEVTEEGLEKLKNDPNVKRIYPNRPVKAFLSDSKNIVNATNTWKLIYNGTNLTGKREVVCVIDTGVDYTHSDMGNCASTSNINDGSCAKVIGGYDFINSDQNPIDDNGHGTHVAGIVASTNITYRGIAPDANIVAIKSLNNNGDGTTATVVNGINWCVDNSSIFNITVISMSLGTTTLFSNYCDNDDPLVAAAVDAAIAKNISVIAATGNAGSTTGIGSPACIKNATAVGWTNKDNTISADSNRNSITDLLAPGSSITSTKNGGGTESNSGTSMSTPHVAATFALIHQYFKLTENKAAMPNETQRYLNNTGKQITDTGGSGLTFSRINIFAAILSLDTLAPNITFVRPTLANKSNSTNATFFINITANEVLVNATLEFNGANETMEGSGLNWFKDKTLDSGAYLYKVWGNDSSNNAGLSELRLIQINNTAPNITSFFPSTLVFSINEPNNQTFNITYDDIDGDAAAVTWYRNSTRVSTSSGFNFTGNFTSSGFYNITAFTADNGDSSTLAWNLTIDNTNRIPSAINVTINSTDFLNRTNGTINVFWSFSDEDEDTFNTWQGNETKWYNNSVEYNLTANLTSISSQNTTKGQNWTFSVRVYDGFNWSEWANSTKITIRNAKPEINITIDSITINETQKANITTNASDIDNDALTFTTNDTRFSLNNIYFTWNTTLNDAGNYALNITVNDTELVDSKIIDITVLDARDLDNDGNPDFNDTDDDNDNINDDNDFLLGNASNINSTPNLNLSLTINGTTNLSKLFNGTFPIIITANVSNNLTNATLRLVEFEYTFNSSNILDFGKITTNYTITGFSGISFRGFTRPSSNFTKNFTIDKVNSTAKAVCIKDADASFESITSACNGAAETLLTCDNITKGQYTCFDTGTRYKIMGLNHSALKELCVDNDGDGYGNGCAAGSDCNDNNAALTTSCSSGSSDSGGGGGSGGGDGGGGGGGGLGVFYICNMDWSCTSWSKCENGWETRECSFVKVPQHTTNESCATIDNVPQRAKKCKTIEKQENKTIEGIMNKTAKDKSDKSGIGITGAAVKDVEKKADMSTGIPIIIIIVLAGTLIYLLFFKKRMRIKQP